jgi:NAD-dependent deacetylase
MVPELERAAALVRSADAVVVVGTSMVVYPAAGLLFEAKRHCAKIVVDPVPPAVDLIPGLEFIAEKASTGVIKAVQRLTRVL